MNDVLREGFERYGTTLFIGALFGSGIGLALIARWWHRRPRQCTECKKPRELLNRKSEQPHLNEGQNKEEDLGSVWFDVWWCARCRDTEVIRRDTVFTRYKPCSGCGHKTALKTDGHTLTYATTFSHGEIEVIETCEHCGHVAKYTRTTPRLQEAVTALYDASSSSSFSDSFSSSSSSDSSSFDGGSSDGGGSSGSW